ncbi:MAG TPA: RHS repeat-associated core domain-containing protein, partial [Terracidiphilus sp.]|nr:RHS repeat-associated core domain-containing protein [Terracidiphilus sp.]
CSGHGYSWNAEGMQSCANGTTYTYDGDEQRVKKSNGTLYWGGGAGAAIAESDLSGNLTEEYIFFNGRRIAMRNTSTHVVSYYVLDRLGSTSVLADAAGNILNDSDYTPYGGEIPFTTGNPAQHYKFTGKERDAESGNDYFGARYFENNMGRWLSPDWSAKVEPVPYSKLTDPQSLNLYAYVGNNPMMRTDPDGHVCPKGSGSPSAGCQNDQNSCKTHPQLCKAILDAMSKGMEAAQAMRSSAQQFANHVGSYFYATGFKGKGEEMKVGVKGVVTLEGGHKEGTEVTRHFNGEREEKQIKSDLHFKIEVLGNFSFGLERKVEGEDSNPKWQFSGGSEGVEGSSSGQVGVEIGFCHGTCNSIGAGVEAGRIYNDLFPAGDGIEPPQQGGYRE